MMGVCVDGAGRRWTAWTYPNPTRDPVGCGRTAGDPGWVCDPDGVLGGDAGIASMDRLVADLREATGVAAGAAGAAVGKADDASAGGGRCRGFQVAVALMERVEGGDDGDAAAATRDMARGLHDAWGVGDARCENGVVLALATRDRGVYISTGRGARKALPDGQVRQVVQGMKPQLREGDVRGAVEGALRALAAVASGEVRLEEPHWLWEWWPVVLFFGVVAAAWAWEALAAHRRRQWARCRQQLSAVEADRARVRAGSYEPTSCAICLEDFPAGTAERWRKNEPALPGVEHLRCGHAYHSPCITKWLERNASCPICRESQHPGASSQAAAPVTRPPPAGSGAGSGAGGAPAGPEVAPDREPLLASATTASPRADISGGTATRTRTSSSSGTRTVTVEDFEPEIRFRLHRINHYYPRFVDRSMLSRWGADPWGTVSFAQDPRLLSRAPPPPPSDAASGRAVSRAARHGTSGTSSMSFGGGSSRGGGGGGGSW